MTTKTFPAEWEWPGEPGAHHVRTGPTSGSERAPLQGFHTSLWEIAEDVRYTILRSWFRDTKISFSEFYGDLPDGGEICIRYSDLAWWYQPGCGGGEKLKTIKETGLHTLAAAVFDISSEDAAKNLQRLMTGTPPGDPE